MSRNVFKARKRAKQASFVMFQHRMLEHPIFAALSGRAVKALMFLASQFRGDNNGDLSCAPKVAQKRGLKAGGNLHRGVMELVEAGFVVQTRQGGRNKCSLYALAWFPIDECGGKLDVPATKTASNVWLWRDRKSYPPTEKHLSAEGKVTQDRAPNSADLSADGQVVQFPRSALVRPRKAL